MILLNIFTNVVSVVIVVVHRVANKNFDDVLFNAEDDMSLSTQSFGS